jgi:DNA mismatch repair ATPase MutL
VIDDGDGIREEDMANFCRTLPNRERNEIYKNRSIGYMGEAMHSLVRSSQVVVFTREKGQKHGFKLQFSHETADLTHKTKV